MGSLAFQNELLRAAGARKSRTGGASMKTRRRGVQNITPVDYRSMDDAQVMLLAGQDDRAAYEHLVVKFQRQICGFLYRMCHNQAVAEELAQEVFLRVYRSREKYTADAKFSTWLYRIATNLAVNHARDTKIERTTPSVSLDDTYEDSGAKIDIADRSINAEQQMVRNEHMAAIKQHVLELPERQRMAVLMHKYQELDYREIAAVLELSESATKSLLFRAYESLREKLQKFI